MRGASETAVEGVAVPNDAYGNTGDVDTDELTLGAVTTVDKKEEEEEEEEEKVVVVVVVVVETEKELDVDVEGNVCDDIVRNEGDLGESASRFLGELEGESAK